MSKDPYEKSAKKYDKYVEPSIAFLRQIALKIYPPKKGMRVLDIGCGTGTNLT
jgi:ubiquinone/menaquinone biosynthesis C-methylase UbiE